MYIRSILVNAKDKAIAGVCCNCALPPLAGENIVNP